MGPRGRLDYDRGTLATISLFHPTEDASALPLAAHHSMNPGQSWRSEAASGLLILKLIDSFCANGRQEVCATHGIDCFIRRLRALRHGLLAPH
jgi:hypothetical protein